MFFHIRHPSSVSIFIVAVLSVSIVTTTQASVITNGCADANVSCTLDELAGGGSIIVDDKLFDNWFISDFSTSVIISSNIQVIALDDQPFNQGLQFNPNGEFSVTGFDLIDLIIGYRVSTLDGSARINGNSLEIDQFSFGTGNTGGFIEIFEDVLDSNGNVIGDKFVTADNLQPSFFHLSDTTNFLPSSTIFAETTILLGGDSSADLVNLDKFTQRFSQIPEPATWLLFGVGLMGFNLVRKNKI